VDWAQQIRGLFWLGRRVWWLVEPALAVSRQYKPCVRHPYHTRISCTGFERVHTDGTNDRDIGLDGKKLKSQYIYLHLNPTQSVSHTSPEPFWTKRGFDLVDELLEIASLSKTEQANPILRHHHAFKIAAHTEVMAGLTELRDLQAVSPRDGQSSDTDEGLDAYSRAHHNPCPAVPPLTDEARLRLATDAQRKLDEAQVAEDKKREEEEQARQTDDKLAHEEAEKVRKAKATQAAQAAADKLPPDAAVKLKAANDAADKRCLATLADVKTAQDALAMAQATWTKANNAVKLAQEHLRAADRAKKKATDVHMA
jgi:hypothetical protein